MSTEEDSALLEAVAREFYAGDCEEPPWDTLDDQGREFWRIVARHALAREAAANKAGQRDMRERCLGAARKWMFSGPAGHVMEDIRALEIKEPGA